MKVFFVFSQYRTGSRLLCSLLDSHPDITCPHESLKPGEDWRQIASDLHNEHQTRFIGLHGHADWLTEDILNSPTEKIVLWREDEILGAVKQTLLHQQRVDGLFNLPSEPVLANMPLISSRGELLFQHGTFNLSYEQLTRGKEVAKMRKRLSRPLLRHIGARRFTLTTTVEKEPPMLPKNLGEIYAEAKQNA